MLWGIAEAYEHKAEQLEQPLDDVENRRGARARKHHGYAVAQGMGVASYQNRGIAMQEGQPFDTIPAQRCLSSLDGAREGAGRGKVVSIALSRD
jgi:hypothetical protein